MKTLLKSLGLLLVCGLLFTCSVNPAKTGNIALSFTMNQGRTLLPDISMEPVNYVIDGTGPEGAVFTLTTGDTQVVQPDLAFGDWTIAIAARNAEDTVIGTGTGTTTVHTGETSVVNLTILPLAGNGSLALTVNWNAADTDFPTIQSQLIPPAGSPLELGFTITGGNAGDYANNAIPAGYYSLVVKLLDGNPANVTPLLTMGAVEVVRIVQDETTSGLFDFTEINIQSGAIQVNITPQMADPIPVTISGQAATLATDGSMTVTASVPPEVGNVTCVWYLNGASQATGTSFTVSGLELGVYRLDAAVFTVDGTRAGSATCSFNVINELIIPGDGLVGEWLFSGDAYDSSGNGNNGIVNEAILSADRFGTLSKSYAFDGINDNITLSDSEMYDFSNSFTINVWVKFHTIKTDWFPRRNTILEKRELTGGNDGACIGGFYLDYGGWNYNSGGGGWEIDIMTTNGVFGYGITNHINMNTWYNVTLIFSPAEVNLYIDGSFLTTWATSGNFISGSQPIDVAKTHHRLDSYSDAEVDDIRIYNRVLDESEIQAIYHEGGWDI